MVTWMRDPYSVLGVRRNAGPDEIKAAWRAVAKAVHPDQNRDDPQASQRFAEAGRAYEVLKDPKLRNRYDYARREAELRRMEEMKRKSQPAGNDETVDAETAEEMVSRLFGTDGRARPQQPARRARQPAPSKPSSTEPKPETAKAEPAEPVTTDTDVETKPETAEKTAIFGILPRAAAPAAELVSAIVRRIRRSANKTVEKVPEIFCEVHVSVEEIFRREKATATLPDGQILKVGLPAGTVNGSVIRLKEQGYRLNGMLRGDVVVTVRIAQDGPFRMQGPDVATTLPINIQDAVLGCETTVEGLTGPVAITIPAWSGSDHVIRLEGLGLPKADGGRGDLLVELRLMLWDKPDEKVTDLMRNLRNGLYL
ncbi:DnaJ C-terminal domain-containing protein [Pararhizobium gei]|uniref:DnaJ C-terminal domain-containing protein n=1 Tax=Pararhizobium gei TaxID=1395951 RepID=UPI0023DB6CE4|nr:DnaJ C-terminal domain-containing protein [Rhizobium gei]